MIRATPLRQAFALWLKRRAPVGAEAIAAVSAKMEPRSFAAGESLLDVGDRANWCFFLVRGLVREAYLDAEGREHTRAFLAEGQATGSLLDLLFGAPAVTWIVALEPTSTLAIPWRGLEAIADRFPDLQLALRRFVEDVYVKKARREFELLTLPAEERHAAWIRDHAAIDPRVKRKVLASYLGVTPEHLSRLRRRARKA